MLIYGERNQKSGCLGLEVGQVLTGKRHEGAFWSDGNVLYLDGGTCGIGYTVGAFVRTHQTGPVRCVYFTVYIFDFNISLLCFYMITNGILRNLIFQIFAINM